MFLRNNRTNVGEEQDRFSLLYLEEGEVYIDDFSVLREDLDEKSFGRMKRCTKSLIYVPDNYYSPILKFPLASITQFTPKEKDEKVIIRTKLVIWMNIDGVHQPYQFKRGNFRFSFKLRYVGVPEFERLVGELHEINASAIGFSREEKLEVYVNELEMKISFDTSRLEDLSEAIKFNSRAKKVSPLVEVCGIVVLTDKRLYFQPHAKFTGSPVEIVELRGIKRIIPRRYLHRHVAVEVFEEEMSSLLLSFYSEDEKQLFLDVLRREGPALAEADSLESHTMKWKRREISNFDYLMFLNFSADRTFNDLTQYPVFPWTISNYSTKDLDMDDPSNFRDLSKPVGALNEARLEQYKRRYEEMPEPKFLYGTHYSTPGFVLYYLIREAPQFMLRLQNGKFDDANRVFRSFEETWNSVCENSADVKELIPDFFAGSGTFLRNRTRIDFGKRQDGASINDVTLPKWADTPEKFIELNRQALESNYVSDNLNSWIDLIFGYKQRGPEAIKANNLFYHLTYEGGVDIESISDPSQRKAYIAQISEFGQTPRQLFTSPHPRRSPVESITGNAGQTQLTDLHNGLAEICSVKLHKAELTDLAIEFMPTGAPALISVSKDCTLSIYLPREEKQMRSVNVSSFVLSSCALTLDKGNIILGSWDNSLYVYSITVGRVKDSLPGAHEDAVSSLLLCSDGERLITASWDGTIRIWRYDAKSRKIYVVPLAEFIDHEAEITSLAVFNERDEEGGLIAAGASDGKIIIWETASFTVMSVLQECFSGPVTGMEFTKLGSSERDCLVSISADGILRILTLDLSDELNVLNFGEALTSLCLIPHATTAIIGTESGNIVLVDLLTCRELSRLDRLLCSPISVIKYSENTQCNERILCVGGENAQVILYDILGIEK